MSTPSSSPSRDREIRQAVAQVTAAMQAANLAQARKLAAAAIAAGIEHPLLYKVEGLWLHQTGALPEALRALHHARQLAPNDPMVLNGIAGVLSAMGQYRAALQIVDAALALAPNDPITAYMQGWTLEALKDYPRAHDAYARTVALNPRHVQALAGLATTALRLEDHAAARAHAERALALDPKQPTAATALALSDIARGHHGEAETRMRGALDSAVSGRARAIILGVLGDALDAQQRFGEAFEAYAAENAALAALHAPGAADGTIDALLRLSSALSGTAKARWNAPAAAPQDQAAVHVFLVGFPRSGTTLIEQILASHPGVVTTDELDLLDEASQRFLGGEESIESLLAASEDELEAARTAYWQSLRRAGAAPAGKVVVDKLPLNTARLPLIARLFPNAKILFAERDPRDVVLSCFRRHFEIGAVSREFLTLAGAARLYDATMRIGAWSRENLPLAFHALRHERLVEDFDGEMEAACRFLGLDWKADEMRGFAASAAGREIASLSAPQVRRGLNADGVGRWRDYAGHFGDAMPILMPWVAKFGYPQD